MNLTIAGLLLIASFEGFSPTLYNDPAGHCTIGYGHLLHTGHCNRTATSERPYLNGITADQGRAILRADAARFEAHVTATITRPLTTHQFDALVSFAFNVGEGGFNRSGIPTIINAPLSDNPEHTNRAVRHALNRHVYAAGYTGAVPGLVRRRALEADWFATPDTPQEDNDMPPFFAWDIDRGRLYFVGPAGARWLTDDETARELAGLLRIPYTPRPISRAAVAALSDEPAP